MNNQVKDLFQLQSELIDLKVDMATTKAIDRVLERISDLKNDIHQLDKHVIALGHRMQAAEENINALNNLLNQIRAKFIEYGFRLVWIAGAGVMLYAISQFHFLLK